jgi:hypothetical protein
VVDFDAIGARLVELFALLLEVFDIDGIASVLDCFGYLREEIQLLNDLSVMLVPSRLTAVRRSYLLTSLFRAVLLLLALVHLGNEIIDVHLDTFSEFLDEHALVYVTEPELSQHFAEVRDVNELLLLVLVFQDAVLIAD